MIDTVELTGSSFHVRSDNALTVQPAPVQSSTGESNGGGYLFTQGGHEIAGVKAYLNTPEGIGATIKHTARGPLAIIHFSAPRVLKGWNTEPASIREAMEATFTVETILESNGLEMDLLNAQLSRLDLNRNAELSRSFTEYLPILESRNGRRMKQLTYHGQGVSWMNTQREVCVYDKGVETANKSKGEHTVELKQGRCLARAEARFKHARTIRNAIGTDRLNALQPEALHEAYMNELTPILRAHVHGQCFSSLGELLDERGWTRGMREYLSGVGAVNLDPAELNSFLRLHSSGKSAHYLRRAQEVFEQAQATAHKSAGTDGSWPVLQEELRRVFLIA